MIAIRAAARLTAAAGLLVVAGCATHGPLIAPTLQSIELADTPFYPQRIHQCGPAALATVLGASHVNVTPDELEPHVFLPQKRGSLQVEMLAAPRQYARLSYEIEPQLSAILQELAAGRPVLVLHNYGVPFWPRWHYAVAIGFDAQRSKLILRSGITRRQTLSATNFMRAWDNGGRWAMVILRPGELPAAPDRRRYLESAASFERVAKPQDTKLAFEAATAQWPDDPVAWIGSGTANYRSGNLEQAAHDYSAALRLDSNLSGARNNLALTLLDLGCARQAQEQLDRIDIAQLKGALRDAVEDTQKQIEARSPALAEKSCRLY